MSFCSIWYSSRAEGINRHGGIIWRESIVSAYQWQRSGRTRGIVMAAANNDIIAAASA